MSAKPISILLVDDDKHLLLTMGDFLTFEGFAVRKAASGEEALREIQRQAPDLIVMDINMPGMGGIAFFKALAGATDGVHIPVVIMTARGAMRDFFQGLNADGFLAKPCSGAEVARLVREVLGRKQGAASTPKVVRGRVLLVESSATNGRRLADSFAEAGYTVDTAHRGLDLFRLAASHRPDVLVLREMLPDMRGSALAAMAKNHPLTERIPCIVYDPSHFLELHAPNEAGRPSAIDLITTNDDAGVLVNAIERLLGHAS